MFEVAFALAAVVASIVTISASIIFVGWLADRVFRC
jgi:hypothetical protein